MYFLDNYKRGIFNRYRKGMPWPEMMSKDLAAWLGIVVDKMKNGTVKTLLVYPHYPSRGSTIYRIARHLGFQVTNKTKRNSDLAIYWEYNTVRNEFKALERIEDQQVINLYNRDISKDAVDYAMQEAFGYSTKIDPEKHSGVAVQKSLKNAVHDGRKVECPVPNEEGFIFQKFIDSSVNDREVMDLRIPLMKGVIPFLYLNYRNNNERFKNVPDRAVLAENVDDWLNENEKEQLSKFCKVFKFDFGELDVLRDAVDGKIYIVDANNTPQGPPKHLPENDKKRAVVLLSNAFQRAFIPSD